MILNEYETTYIVRPDLTDDIMKKLTTKFEQIVADNAGTMLVAEDWGKRKLAYLIRRHTRGHFVYLNYCGPGNIVRELERNLGNEDDLRRYLTVQIEASVDVDSRRVLAEERRNQRVERMAALKAEEEAEARYRAEAEDAEDDAPIEEVE